MIRRRHRDARKPAGLDLERGTTRRRQETPARSRRRVRFQLRVQVFGIQLVDLAARSESAEIKKNALVGISLRPAPAPPVHSSLPGSRGRVAVAVLEWRDLIAE